MSVYVSKPSNVTGVTLSNPVSDDGTYALTLQTGTVATGGNIVYTNAAGLDPHTTPQADTKYCVHKFNDMTVVDAYGTASITFTKAIDCEVLLVGGGDCFVGDGVDRLRGSGAGGYRSLNISATAKTYSLHIGRQTVGDSNSFDATQPHIGSTDTIWDVGGTEIVADGGIGTNVDGPNGAGGATVQGTLASPGNGNVPSTTPAQGKDGGTATLIEGFWSVAAGAGGGGIGSIGYDWTTDGVNYTSGKGGDGVQSSISGVPSYYAAGGGGGIGVFNGASNLYSAERASGIGGRGSVWGANNPALVDKNAIGWTGSGGGTREWPGLAPLNGTGNAACGIIIVRYKYTAYELSWGGGTPVEITGDGTYSLDDGSGNTIDAVVDFSSLPSGLETDNIIICNDPIHTDAATNIAGKTMTANGEIFVSGATTRGFCYKAGVVTPTIADSKVYSTGSFVAEAYDKGMTGLSRETTYSIRAYMYIDGDLYYGTVVTAKTLFGIISMAITPVNQFIDLGETQQYTVTATMDDASTQDITDRCTYTSSDTDVATISNTPGTIGLATGTSTPTTTNSWSYGTGWSVVGSTAVHTGATSGLMLNGMRTTIEATFVCDDGTFTDDTYLFVSFLISGGNYTIQFYVTGMGSGASVTPYIGSTAGVAVAENGCHVQNIVAPASARYINFAAVGTLTVEKVLIFIEKNLTVSTDQTELPSQYQHLMVLYATACGLNKDKKYQAANITAAMYNSELIYAKTNLEDIVPDSKSDVRRK